MGRLAELNRTVKTQQIRLMDVFLLGPFMVYSATLIPEKHKEARAILAASGVLTSLFNGINYLVLRKEMEK